VVVGAGGQRPRAVADLVHHDAQPVLSSREHAHLDAILYRTIYVLSKELYVAVVVCGEVTVGGLVF
jgi:hypothetical protein